MSSGLSSRSGPGQVTITYSTPDTTPPVTRATPAPGTVDHGLPLVTVTGTATIKDNTGSTIGSDAFTCFDTHGLQLSLAASDAGASGVANLTYAASGAQTIVSTTVDGATARPSITALGVTTLTYAATDVAGNQEATRSESVIVGGDLACAGPTPTFSLPRHGTLQLNGTATANGRTYFFNRSISF